MVSFQPNKILDAFLRHEVDFVLVGGVCAVFHAVPLHTFDLDVVHSRHADNLPRLLSCLQELGAYYRYDPRKLSPGTSHLQSPGHQLLYTNFGPLDLLGTIDQGKSYEDLLPGTQTIYLQSRPIKILSLSFLIEIKERAGRDKDKLVLPLMKHTLRLQQNVGTPEDP